MIINWGICTDQGRVRAINEDSYLAEPAIFVVADGMGGHAAGDVASRIVVQQFSALAERTDLTPEDIDLTLSRAAAEIRRSLPAGRVGGSTVCGAALVSYESAPYWLVFNVGDSRAYLVSEGEFAQISVDHSVVQEMIDAGRITPQEASTHPERNVITRAVDNGSIPEADYWLLPLASADRLLLCSDGLTGEVSDSEVQRLLMAPQEPQIIAQELVQSALRGGGRDNITVIVVEAREQLPGENIADYEVLETDELQLRWAHDYDGPTVPRHQSGALRG